MTYETNERIPTLSEVRRKEREEAERQLNIEAKELLQKAISYYNINYPNSNYEIVWEKNKVKIVIGDSSIEKEIEYLNEEELRSLYDIFTYYHDERQMPKIIDHNLRSVVLNMVMKLIPGGTILDELYELYEGRKKINKEIEKLEDTLNKKRETFKNRLEENKNLNPINFVCDVCEKICKSLAGLKMHSKVHSKIHDK